jgi:hypothetical protein
MRAGEAVHDRMLRATTALQVAGVSHAVIGGNAVAAWVGSVDEAAVRYTKDVDLLLRREDMESAKEALAKAGFIYHETFDVPMFIDGPKGGAKDAVHVIYADEKVKPDDLAPAPSVQATATIAGVRALSLEQLVLMKLTSHRRKDQVHIQDLIGVGLIDASWVTRFPPELAARLQVLLDDPTG